MFGQKKNEPTATNDLPQVQVTAIPVEFYGGQNPVVKFKTVEKVITPKISPVSVVPEKKPAPPASPVAKTVAPTVVLSNRRTLIFGSISLFLLFIVATSGYYWWQATHSVKPPVQSGSAVTEPTPIIVATVPTTTVAVVTPTSTVITPTNTPTASSTLSLSGGKLDFPSILLGDSVDGDHDGLTDVEEDLYKTDPKLPDTDSDQYSDATEIYNLYSPITPAPTRLIDSGLVQDYVNPVWGYRLYYPVSWAVGSVDAENRDVLFSSVTGENVEMRVFDRTPGQSFEDWFAIWAPDEHLSSLRDFSTVFKAQGKSRSDSLVYYFTDDSHVYVVLYHSLPGANTVNFRSTIGMVARSFRLSTTPNILPNQPVVVPATTTGQTNEAPL